jgi:O-antigen ligase
MQTVVAILLVSLLFGAVMFGFSDLITSRLFGGDYGSAESRIPASKIAWSIIKENALLGVGVRKYDTVVHLYNPLVRDMHVKLVHNAYLQLAAERGILALVVMLFLQFSSFSLGLRNLKKNETFLVAVNIGFLASVAALWAHWIVDIGGLGRASLTWVIIGLIAATSQVATSRESFQSNVVTSSPR